MGLLLSQVTKKAQLTLCSVLTGNMASAISFDYVWKFNWSLTHGYRNHRISLTPGVDYAKIKKVFETPKIFGVINLVFEHILFSV